MQVSLGSTRFLTLFHCTSGATLPNNLQLLILIAQLVDHLFSAFDLPMASHEHDHRSATPDRYDRRNGKIYRGHKRQLLTKMLMAMRRQTVENSCEVAIWR